MQGKSRSDNDNGKGCEHMQFTWNELLVFPILFFANLIQAITGFAGTLLSMPPTMQLIGVGEAKTLLAAIDQISCLLIVLTGWRAINWKEFGKMAVLMVAGMFAGMKIFEAFPAEQLLTFYGLMILVIALWRLFGSAAKARLCPGSGQNDSAPQKPPFGRAGKVVMPLVILAAGVIHGMFVSGGALLVIYASSALKDKEEFRATMAMLWVTIGCYITATQLRSGYFDQKLLCMLGIGLIPVFAGIWIGTKLVKRIRQETFMKLTYVLLILSGILAMV